MSPIQTFVGRTGSQPNEDVKEVLRESNGGPAAGGNPQEYAFSEGGRPLTQELNRNDSKGEVKKEGTGSSPKSESGSSQIVALKCTGVRTFTDVRINNCHDIIMYILPSVNFLINLSWVRLCIIFKRNLMSMMNISEK